MQAGDSTSKRTNTSACTWYAIHTTRLVTRDYSGIRSYRAVFSRSALYNVGHYKNKTKYLSFYRPALLRQTDDRNMTWRMCSGEIALHHNSLFRSLLRSYDLEVLDASQQHNEPRRCHETWKAKTNLRTCTTAKVRNDDKCRSYHSTPTATFRNISPTSEYLRHYLFNIRKLGKKWHNINVFKIKNWHCKRYLGGNLV